MVGRIYHVPAGPGWVDVYESGELCLRVCVEPVERLPQADVVLAHKLMIEGDEQRYMWAANILYVSPAAAFADWPDIWRGFRRRCWAAGLRGVAEPPPGTSDAPTSRNHGEEAMERAPRLVRHANERTHLAETECGPGLQPRPGLQRDSDKDR